MPQYPSIAAGTRITSSLLNAMIPTLVVQSADLVVNASTTLVDTDLAFSADANSTYLIRLWATYSSGTTPDAKFNWSIPSGATLQRVTQVPQAGVTGTDNTGLYVRRRSTTATVGGGDGTGNFPNLYEEIIARTTNAGTIKLQFAQNTSDASNTTFRADSYIEYRQYG